MTKAIFCVVIAIGVFVGGLLTGRALLSNDNGHGDQPTTSSPESAATEEAEQQNTVTIDEDSAARINLQTQVLAPATVAPQTTAYGLIENDPASVFILRAPVAGTLRAAPGKPWPSLGANLPDGAAVGAIEPRVTAMERADLASRLAAARSEAEQARASLDAAQHSYESKRALNEQGRIVSDRVIEAALANLKSEEARLKAAEDTMKLIRSTLSANDGPAGPFDLTVARGGEVVDVAAQPDESIEAGQPILRVARFDRLLARVTAPPGQLLSKPPHSARVVAAAMPNHPFDSTMLSVMPAIDARLQGAGLIFAIDSPPPWLRPGMSVRAYINLPGDPQSGVVIPRSAIVRHAGASWVFIAEGKNEFVRRGVSLDQPVAGGWFSMHGAKPGDRVVVVGAEPLLGQELKSHFQAAEEEE